MSRAVLLSFVFVKWLSLGLVLWFEKTREALLKICEEIKET